MKTKILFLTLLLSCCILSCKKDKKDEPAAAPAVSLAISYGYYGTSSFSMVPFSNQSSMPDDSIMAHQSFVVSFTEFNIPGAENLEFDSLKFEFDVNTKNDQEHFIGSENTASSSTGIFTFGNKSEVNGEYGLPFKFSNTAKQGNDTIEISNADDFIKVNYTSHHSTLKGDKTINILH